MTPIDRRGFLGLATGGAAMTMLAACGASSTAQGSNATPTFGASMAMSLFGTTVRQKRLQSVFALYTAKFGGAVDAQIVANDSYIAKLATEVVGGAAADVISL